jgi:hypothetical protein
MGRSAVGLWLLLGIGSVIVAGCSPQEGAERAEREDQLPIFGEGLPGTTAQLFAPHVLPVGLPVKDIAILPDESEIYFSIVYDDSRLVTIAYTKLVDGRWTEPAIAPFATDRRYFYSEFHITPDGEQLLFSSTRPVEGEAEQPGYDVENIWVVDRVGGGWGEPYDIGAPINTLIKEFLPSTTRDGTLYFAQHEKGGSVSLFRSKKVNGEYLEPEKLPPEVNAGLSNFNGYIAPDDSYILFSMVKGEAWEPEYHVSFHRSDDTWTQAVPLDERISLPGDDGYTQSVSSNGKYIFFMSKKEADAEALFSGPTTFQQVLSMATNPANGSLNAFWIDASVIGEFDSRD